MAARILLSDFKLVVYGLMLSVAACSTSPPAPVIDRAPVSKPSAPSVPTSPSTAKPTIDTSAKTADWRPDDYIVKKGDTLISIGLEYGHDYKEIAEANNLTAPYTIKIGQTLKLGSLNEKPVTATPTEDGVVITPIKIDSPVNTTIPPKSTTTEAPGATKTENQAQTKGGVLVLSEPKAIREIYSEEAYKRIVSGVKPATTAPATTVKPESDVTVIKEPDSDAKANTKSTTDASDDVDWLWPTKGKIVGNFSENSNKGMDIAGTTGQSIVAAAGGKVIYSGSDLRGYGKLVIIKHNKNFLSVYAHNSQILVKEGQQVSRGQKIAEMGNTDSSTVKLHFEIRRQGKSVDPAKYLTGN